MHGKRIERQVKGKGKGREKRGSEAWAEKDVRIANGRAGIEPGPELPVKAACALPLSKI